MTQDVLLTPPWLCGQPPMAAPGMALVRAQDELLVKSHDHKGLPSWKHLEHESWRFHLAIFRLAYPAPPEPVLLPWTLAPMAPSAAKAIRAANLGDWEEVGKAADAGWCIERAVWPDNSERDCLYASLRLAGAWGGRPAGNILSLWFPAPLREKLVSIATDSGAILE